MTEKGVPTSQQASADTRPARLVNIERGLNRRTFLIMAGLSPVIAVAACAEQDTKWKTYTSSIYPYQIDYPSTFSTQTIPTVGDLFGGGVVNGFPTLISIKAEPLNLSLDQYTSEFVASAQRFNNGQDTVTVLASPLDPRTKQVFKVSGNDAYQIGVHAPQGANPAVHGVPYDMTATLITAKGLYWTITLFNESSVTQKYRPIYKHMLDTFQLTR